MTTLLQQIQQLQAEAKRAIEAYRRRESRLYIKTKAGKKYPRYPEQQQQELLKEAKAERNRVLRAIEEEMQQLLKEAGQQASTAQQFSPESTLTPSEREAVSARLPLVERDIQTIPPRVLAQRLEGACAAVRGRSNSRCGSPPAVGLSVCAKRRGTLPGRAPGIPAHGRRAHALRSSLA